MISPHDVTFLMVLYLVLRLLPLYNIDVTNDTLILKEE